MPAPIFSEISIRRVPAGTVTVRPMLSKVTLALGMAVLFWCGAGIYLMVVILAQRVFVPLYRKRERAGVRGTCMHVRAGFDVALGFCIIESDPGMHGLGIEADAQFALHLHQRAAD